MMNFAEYASRHEALDPNSKALAAIRAGVNLRNPGQGDFWNDFLRICNQADALAALLEVPKEKIAKWPSLIRKHLDDARRLDAGDAIKRKASMITTGY